MKSEARLATCSGVSRSFLYMLMRARNGPGRLVFESSSSAAIASRMAVFWSASS